MGYKYFPSSGSSACCDPNHAGYLGTKKAKHISSFVEFYQVSLVVEFAERDLYGMMDPCIAVGFLG